MATSPREIYELALRLIADRDNEASLRSALSRAYYAALLETEATFQQGKRLGHESSHAVISASAQTYGRGANPGREYAGAIAIWLPKMRRARNIADYHLGETCTEDHARAAVARAAQILEFCEKIKQRRAAAEAVKLEQPPG